MHIQIYSEYDGWSAQVLNDDGDRLLKMVSWNHGDAEWGTGGEKKMAELLEYLGHTVYIEDVY